MQSMGDPLRQWADVSSERKEQNLSQEEKQATAFKIFSELQEEGILFVDVRQQLDHWIFAEVVNTEGVVIGIRSDGGKGGPNDGSFFVTIENSMGRREYQIRGETDLEEGQLIEIDAATLSYMENAESKSSGSLSNEDFASISNLKGLFKRKHPIVWTVARQGEQLFRDEEAISTATGIMDAAENVEGSWENLLNLFRKVA